MCMIVQLVLDLIYIKYIILVAYIWMVVGIQLGVTH